MSNYDWLLTGRTILLEGYAPPLYPKLDYDPEYAAGLVKSSGANILRFPALSYYAYYPTRHYLNHPQLDGRDLLKETIDVCHRKGIKVIPYIPVGHPFLPYDSKLEPYDSWAKLDEHGDRIGWWHHGYFHTYFICLNTPYRQAIKGIVEEIVTGYDVDGIYFDGPYQDQDASGVFCHCPYCRKAYFDKTGKDIPGNSHDRDWNNVHNLEYLDWVVNDVKRELMKELNAIIKKKDIPHLFNNCNWLMNKYWGGDRYRDLDGFMFEGVHTAQEKLLHIMLGRSTHKYIWSYVSSYEGSASEHLVTDIPGCSDFPGIPLYGQELQNEGYTVLTGNGAPIYYGLNRIYHRQDTLDSVREIFDFIKENEGQLQRCSNKKFIGMWISGSTRDWWYKNDPAKNSKYRCFYYGGFNVLKDLYHQVEPFYMSSESKPDFSEYKVVFLPNAACMSDEEADTLRKYVMDGGNLIATFMTSLYDEYGNKRGNFALSDIFGADYTEKELEIRRDTYMKIIRQHPVTDGFYEEQLIPQDLQALTVEAANESEVLAFTTGIGHDIDISPAIIARSCGKGKVVYLPGGLEALYRTSRYSELSKLFDNIIKWMCGGSIPYNVEGPGGLVVNMAEGAESLLLHIVNNNGAIVKYAPTREKYVPVHNIKVSISVGVRGISSVRLLHSGLEPSWSLEEGLLTVSIDRIDIYECVSVVFGQ